MNPVDILYWYSETSQELVAWYVSHTRTILDYLHIGFNATFVFFLWIAIGVSVLYYGIMVYSVLVRKKPQEQTLDRQNAPFVSIQIPTFNELAALNCAKQCLDFDYPKDKFEILIGDDSNNQEVSEAIDLFAKKSPQVIVTRRGLNTGFKPGNLNHMLKHSRGEILVLFDSDFLPPPDFLSRIVAPFQKSDVSVVQARWKILNPNTNLVTVLGSTMSTVFHNTILPFVQNFGKISFLCGSAEAIRKSDLLEVGGWKSGCLTEDIECSLRLLSKNKKFLYLPDLACECEVPYTPQDLYKQQMRWAYGVIGAFKEHTGSLIASTLSIRSKIAVFIFGSGYLFSFLLLALFFFGTLSFVTHAPAPLDLPRFITEMLMNVALTSGLLMMSLFSIVRQQEIKRVDKVLYSSFTYGIIVTYYVYVGIMKVLLNKPMHWFMLEKKGNTYGPVSK